MRASIRYTFSVLAIFGSVASASAQVAAFKLSGGGQTLVWAQTYTLGYRFTLTEPTTVTKLGWQDLGDWGSTQVGIFGDHASGGPLLASANISQASGELFEGFRYTTLATPLALARGKYTIAGVGRTVQNNIKTIDPVIFGLTYEGAAWGAGNALTSPSETHYTLQAFFGPNFQAVPEPSTMAAFGVAGLALLRRRRKVQP
jgi:hypothetical protein